VTQVSGAPAAITDQAIAAFAPGDVPDVVKVETKHYASATGREAQDEYE
jgi:hypothetical protein